jgi:hypothetical protein
MNGGVWDDRDMEVNCIIHAVNEALQRLDRLLWRARVSELDITRIC